MNFKQISRLSALLAKEYAESFIRLLVMYRDISASEAASRLDLHIKTAQDFLEELLYLGIVEKREVFEKKRPYFRYTLIKEKLTVEIDFTAIYDSGNESDQLSWHIKEKMNAGATFTTSADNTYISSVSFMVGEGRKRKVRKISLTELQGRFMFYLPFPSANFMSISDIMKNAGIDKKETPEILDIVNLLLENGVIEMK